MRIFSLLAGLAAVVTTPAMAQDDQGGLKGLGVGVIIQTQPYVGVDEETQANIIPSLAYSRGRLWVSGKQVGLKLTDPASKGPWEVSALLDYRFQGYEANDSPALVGMEDRDGTLEAGTVITYDMGAARLVGQARADVLEGHGGFDLSGQAELNWAPAKYTLIRPYAGISFRSEEHADYYYGVRDNEVLLINNFAGGADSFNRTAYAPGETLNPFVGIAMRQALSKHLVVGLFVQHEFLPEEIKDSPIVDEKGKTTMVITFAKPFVK